MESNQENNLEITPKDELEATDLAEISGGTGHYGGHEGKGGGKSIKTGNINIIDDVLSNNTINIGGEQESEPSTWL